jgi:phosphoglucan,water dikinase
VVLINRAAGDEEIPKSIAAIALAHEIPHLSHLAVRARQSGVVFVTCDEASELERLRGYAGQVISFTALPDNVKWESRMEHISQSCRPRHMAAKMGDVQICAKRPLIRIENALAETSGAKAAGMRRLAEISSQRGSGFLAPYALVVPFGVMEETLSKFPGDSAEYLDLSSRIDALEPAAFAQASSRLCELVERLEVPEIITKEIQERFGSGARLAVRSSANCEDLKEFAGAGLYQSVINVAPADIELAIRAVWSSLWTQRAAESRRAGGIPHDRAHMAVLIQESLTPDFSFVLHTVNPITREVKELYAEIAVGLGEVLASATTAGSPYRITINKQSSAVEILAFANFSQAVRPDPAGGVRRETVDYSKISLSKEAAEVEKMGRHLSAIGVFVEHALGGPQDIEGAVVNERVYLVQARPQQGLDNSD